MKINENDLSRIATAVKVAEQNTSGEIVPVILKQSDLYPAAHFRLSLVVGITFAIGCYYGYEFEDPITLLWFQLPGMLIGYLLAYIPQIKRAFSTGQELSEESYQRAVQVFHEHNVSMTRDRTGIMIFITLLERKVYIMADAGINQQVADDYWDQMVATLVESIKNGRAVEGLEEAIKECGNSLSSAFPRQSDDQNEISDDLVTE